MRRNVCWLALAAALLLAQAAWADAQEKSGVVAQVTGELILGGAKDGKFAGSKEAAALLQGGEKYQIYSLTKKWGEATGNKPKYIEQEEGYHDAYVLELSPLPENQESLYALHGDWNALPRVPKITKQIPAAYGEDLSALLRQKGLPDAKVHITQALRVDLEGDGVEEVLLSATNDRPDRLSFTPAKGDYTLVALRKLVGKEVITILIDGKFYTKGGLAENDSAQIYTIPALLDVNGDGVMEIFVAWEYYEGNGTEVYSVRGDKVKCIFGGGWGV